jgi:hypothetical protein
MACTRPLTGRLRTRISIDRITIGKVRPQSGFQAADAKYLSIGKSGPQLIFKITKSGLQVIVRSGPDLEQGRTAGSRRPRSEFRGRSSSPEPRGLPRHALDDRPARPRVRPLSRKPRRWGATGRLGSAVGQRAAQRRQARQGERACLDKAERALARRPPGVGRLIVNVAGPQNQTAGHHQHPAKQIDRSGRAVHRAPAGQLARSRRRRELARNGARPGTAHRRPVWLCCVALKRAISNAMPAAHGFDRVPLVDMRQRRTAASAAANGVAPSPVPRAGSGCPCARCLAVLAHAPLSVTRAARCSRTLTGFLPKYLSARLGHASGDCAVLLRISWRRFPTFV